MKPRPSFVSLRSNLTGFDPATAVLEGGWATDNVGTDIILNGTSTGLNNSAQFGALTRFTLNAGFKAGMNTIDFAINNAGSDANPTGLRVEGLRLGARPAGSARPSLAVARSGNEITLSWSKGAEGYRLFFTRSLSPANWQAVPEPVTASGDSNTVKAQASGETGFYRLQAVGP